MLKGYQIETRATVFEFKLPISPNHASYLFLYYSNCFP